MSQRTKPAITIAKSTGTEQALTSVAMLASELRKRELETAKARARFEQAVRRAGAGGLSQLKIAAAAGLSRQRIAQLLAKEAA